MQRRKQKAKLAQSNYPCVEDIEQSGRARLGYLLRYLEPPGAVAIGYDNWENILAMESAAYDLIEQRFDSLGGWNDLVSKAADLIQEMLQDDKEK